MRILNIVFAFTVFLFVSPATANDLLDIISAAEQDNVDAQMTLGGMYEIGLTRR